jgi:hypothetical protein
LNNGLTLSVTCDNPGNRFERFCDIEPDIGDIIIRQTERSCQDLAFTENSGVERGSDSLFAK